MALDHNDQRAQNFTSGAALDKHLNKVIVPSGKNAELIEKLREIVAAGVKDIYGDASDRKYQKIVNLIMKRMGAKLEDTGISSDLKELSQSLTKDLNELKKDVKAASGKSSKSDKGSSTDKNLNSLLEKIQDKIIEFRKEQKKELSDLKSLIKSYSSSKASQKTEAKKTEPADKKPKKEEKEAPPPSGADSNFAAFANEITTAISDLKQHVEFALDAVSTKLALTNDLITTQFAHFDLSFNQIQTQLTNSFQQNARGFSDVNANIKATSQNILQAISQINAASGSSPAASVAALPAQIIASITSVIASTMSALTTTMTTSIVQAITPLFQQSTVAVDKIATKKTDYIVGVIDRRTSTIISAINKSTKKTQKNSSDNVSRLDKVQQFLGRMRNSVERRVRAVNTLVNRWGKKHTKQINQLKPGLFKRIFSGIGSLFKLILGPIGFMIGGIFGMLSFIFKPLTWLLGFFNGPAMLLFLVGALVFLWPHISEFISGWWDEYIAPAFNWIFEQVSALWETISTAVSEWWTAKWAPYGGFGGFLTDVVWPKIQTFFTTVLWPFVTEKVWPFIKQHWKGILMAIGIFTFLKNPMAVFKMALQIPILILKSIQAAIAIIKIISYATKVISLINQALIAAMPAIIAALPYILVAMLVVALVAAVVAAFSWFTEDSYEDLAEQQEKIFKTQQEQLNIDWEKNIKKWTENDYQSRFEKLQDSIDRVDKNTQKMLELQNLKTVQKQRFKTGINGMSATGAEIKEMMDKAFSTESLERAAKDANGGKAVYNQSFSDITSQVNQNADRIAGVVDKLRESQELVDNDENGAIPQIEIDRYNNLKLYLNLAIANLSHLFDYAQGVATNFAKDTANWSNDPETMKDRIAAFRNWFATAKDKSANELMGHFKNALSHRGGYEVDRVWPMSDYYQHTLGFNGDEGYQRFNNAATQFNDVVRNTRSEIIGQLQNLMVSPKLSEKERQAVKDSINGAIMNADREFDKLNERLKTSSGNATGFTDKNLEQTISEVQSQLGKDSAFAKANGYASIGFVKQRIENLENLKKSATEGLYNAGLERWNRSKGSVDEKYLTQLEDALVAVGSTDGRNGVLSAEDKIKTYTAILANVSDEFAKTDDEEAKKRLGQIEQALRKQLNEFNEEEKKRSGRDIMAENRANIVLTKKWYDLSEQEKAKYGTMENFIKSQQGVVVQQNNSTTNNFGNNPNTLDSAAGKTGQRQ